MRRITIGIFAVVAGTIVFFCGRPSLQLYRLGRSIRQSQAAMQLPKNFKPAERVMARMAQSDPNLFNDPEWMCLDWIPPELGKLSPHYITIKPEDVRVDMGGGFVDNFHYELSRAPQGPDTTTNSWTLTFTGQDGREIALDTFAFPATDRIDEEELVKRALAELARRQTAFADGSQLNVYGDDPDDDRRRLLAQHPAIAAKLGFTVPATQPATTSMPPG